MWKIQKSKQVLEEGQKLLLIVILAGYISYLVQNFFGFSVVIIAVFFYIFPALAVVFVGDLKPLQLPKKLHRLLGGLLRLTVLRGSIYQKTVSVLLVLGLLFVLGNLSRNWMADFLYKTGSDASDSGEIEQAYLDLSDAVQLNEGEPLYRSELGFTMADVASALKTEDASTSAELAEEAVRQTKLALSISPKNISLWRTAVRAYYQMSLIDPTYVDRALEALDESIKLAPTDPKLYYNKGLVLSQNGKVPEGVEALKEAIKLKSNYTEAHFTLSLLYEQLKEKDLAIQEMEEVLKLDPGNEDAVRKIEELKEE